MPKISEKIEMSSRDADQVYQRLIDLHKYPELAPSVLSVEVGATGATTISDWEVEFRGGVMRWREEDSFVSEARTYAFHQITGDLESFSGKWHVDDADDGAVALLLDLEFDLGMPSLSDLVDPVATRALLENMREIASAIDAECLGKREPK